MNIFTKYTKRATRAAFGLKKAVELATSDGFGIESIFDTENMSTYKKSLYVYIGVSMIARSVADIVFDYYKITNSKGEIEEVLDHEIIDRMNTPNSYLTRKEFIELSSMFYLLSGDVFWYFERGKNTNEIVAVHPLVPNKVEIVLNNKRDEVLGYKYQMQNAVAFLLPENVVHTKSIDPTNIIRGFGILTPAATRIATESEATNYQSNFFKNQGRPDVAVFVDKDINQEQIDEGRSKWQEVYGRGQGGQAGFFGKSIKDVKMLNVTPREMDFIATQNFLRDDILAVLHIPKAMITSDDVNLANSKTARINYMQEAVLPVLNAFKDAINNRLLPRVDDTLFVSYVNPVPEDRDIKLREATELKKAGIISANEARDLYEYESVEGADELATINLGGLGLQALETEAKYILRTRTVLRKRYIAVEKTVRAMVAVKKFEKKNKMNSLLPDSEVRYKYALAINKSVDAKAVSVEAAIKVYFQGAYERVIKSAELHDAFSAENFMDKTVEQIEIKRIVVPVLEKVLANAGQETLDMLFTGQKTAVGEEFVLTDALLATYTERFIFFANSITDTTFEAVKGTILSGLAAGDGTDAIGRALRAQFDDMSVVRGKLIARTETGYAQSLATNEAYAQSSVVTGKQWVTLRDGNVRVPHQVNEAAGVIGKNDVFPSGEMYPAQHSINCRCVLVPAL